MQNVNLSAVFHHCNLIRPDRLLQISESMRSAFHYVRQSAEQPERGMLWMAGGKWKVQKSVAVMGLYGMIDKRSSWMMDFMGGTSTDMFGAMFDQMVNDPMCKGIVIDTDSPGGSAVGTSELSRKIYDARAMKPIVAIANAEMCSAAYYIASAASAVFATPSSSVGSIGVWSAAMEYSKQLEEDGVKVHVWRATDSPMKAGFLPYQEFSKDSIKEEQEEVDRIYGEFISDVARNRGMTRMQAQKNFGEGRVMGSKAALTSGLIDKISTLDDVVSRIESGKITAGAFTTRESLDAAFSEPIEPDDSWRDENETTRLRSRLARKGLV